MLISFEKPKAGALNIIIPKDLSAIENIKNPDVRAQKLAHVASRFLTIAPGINDIPDTEWNLIRNDSVVVRYRAKGWILLKHANENIEKKDKDGVVKNVKDLTAKTYKELSVVEQEAIIKDTELMPLLKKLKKDTKEGAMARFNDKMSYLKDPTKHAENDDYDEEDED